MAPSEFTVQPQVAQAQPLTGTMHKQTAASRLHLTESLTQISCVHPGTQPES
jgi:hypothetical protein